MSGSDHVNGLGQPIPAEQFEHDHEVRPLPLNDEQRRQFEADIEALRKFKR